MTLTRRSKCQQKLEREAVVCIVCGAEVRSKRLSYTLSTLLFSSLVITVVAMIVIPNLFEARKHGGEVPQIGALKTIGTAQSLFREMDYDGDGLKDYGTLSELANAGTNGLIDSVLGSGTAIGYLFEVSYGASTSEFIWFATARPAKPGTRGRYFCTNHEGATFYTSMKPFSMNTVSCTIPATVQPVGR